MADTFSQIYLQFVFAVKHRQSLIAKEHKEELHKYIGGIIKNKNCKPYRINGMDDHIHIFSDMHPSVCLADYVKDIKVSTNFWMKKFGRLAASCIAAAVAMGPPS